VVVVVVLLLLQRAARMLLPQMMTMTTMTMLPPPLPGRAVGEAKIRLRAHVGVHRQLRRALAYWYHCY
jgi:hypothetical protein